MEMTEEDSRRALSICRSCKVQAECLAVSLDAAHDGIWGGMTTNERRLLRLGRPAWLPSWQDLLAASADLFEAAVNHARQVGLQVRQTGKHVATEQDAG